MTSPEALREDEWNRLGIFFNQDSEIERANEIRAIFLTDREETVREIVENLEEKAIWLNSRGKVRVVLLSEAIALITNVKD